MRDCCDYVFNLTSFYPYISIELASDGASGGASGLPLDGQVKPVTPNHNGPSKPNNSLPTHLVGTGRYIELPKLSFHSPTEDRLELMQVRATVWEPIEPYFDATQLSEQSVPVSQQFNIELDKRTKLYDIFILTMWCPNCGRPP